MGIGASHSPSGVRLPMDEQLPALIDIWSMKYNNIEERNWRRMINYAHGQRNQYNSTPLRTLACTVVFLDLSAFFFLSFMNICFDEIVSHPPVWLLFILFMIMALDLLAELYFKKRITIVFCLNLVIIVLLSLSWVIKKPTVVIFLSGLVFLRFPEVVRYNEIMQDKLRSRSALFKLYTVAKIFYMIAVVGHVLGCIFYAIDNTLIKQEYYGNIAENPSMYYQGQLLCYSPIYSLSEINRYLYCMYYIVSLLATVAYGDIIPKNPFENAYVCLLLVLSTVSISFIIEQLLIVLSGNWDTIYDILKKLKYFDSMLAKSLSISSRSRLTLVNFVFHSMLHEATNDPNIHRLTPSLQRRLMAESIGLQKVAHSLDSKQGRHKIVNLRILTEYSMPSFLAEHLLLKLELQYFPSKYLLVDNENRNEANHIYITMRGEIQVGYGPRLLMRKTVSHKNKLFCWREFILDNKCLHRHFRIETKILCELYAVSADTLRGLLKGEQLRSLGDENYSKMLQNYHTARQKELLHMYEETHEIDQSTQSLALIQLESHEPEEDEHGVSPHIMRCWGCGKRKHFPINCPNLHLKLSVHEMLAHSTRNMDRAPRFQRTQRASRKVKASRKVASEEQRKTLFVKRYLVRKNEQLRNLRSFLLGTRPHNFQQYEGYENYYHEFNFQSHNSEEAS